ncbi:uncharacterized protein LOC126563054 [Anopheles maculipalpis]|uniref:uncharacterized protein LOC126563054 n=1 Tax=Anopheles maculipalpis TaxID=1496333 RepID=UPI002158E9C4|nr:uncharacterized protein LOC126563054 [Anopheles maculipalpis]
MPLPTLNRRQSSASQQRRRHLLLPLLATVLALAGLATCAPTKRNTSLYTFNVTLELSKASTIWKEPCGQNGQGKVSVSFGASFNKSIKYRNMESQIHLTLLDLNNWRHLPDSNNTGTNWNTNALKRQFKFLQPFLKNESSWERRLSVYWAYLKMVRLFHEQNSATTNINQKEADALERVNEASRQLLCMVQEYRVVTKLQNKLIDAEQMERKIKFNIQDASEININLWYYMCRLECFLTHMRKHLHQLRVKGKRPRKQIRMRCKSCPYCSKRNEEDDTAKAPKKKHRKQQQQQQHQPPRKHNRDDCDQEKHKPNRQPKGRKGSVRTTSKHA